MTDAALGYLLGVQITTPCAVPFLPVFVTATLGSGLPPIVRPRNDGSIDEKLLCAVWMKTTFCRRGVTGSVDMFTTKPAGISAASASARATLAPPRLSRVR